MGKSLKLTPDIIYGFSQTFLASKYDNPKPTPDFHFLLWDYFCSSHPKVAVAAPRGHAKTTGGTQTYGLAEICFRLSRHILLLSDTETQAAQFLGNMKTELRENEELRSVFGIKDFLVDTQTEIVGRFSDNEKFRILAKGSGQSLRGALWHSGTKIIRPDLVLGDDLENDELVITPERREKFRKWFYNSVLPLLSDYGKVRIVGTILHLDALLERLMPKEDCLKTELYDYYEDYSERPWKSIRFRAHDDDYSNILWPEKFSEKRLRMIRQDYVEQGNPEGYAQEYLNYPIDDSTAYFRRDDLLPIKTKEENLNYYVGTDFAVTEKNKRDYSVFVVAGMNPDGILKVVDVVKARMDSLQIIEEFFNLQKRYNPESFIVEKGAIWNALSPLLHDLMMKRQSYPIINELPATGDKMGRAQAIRGRMRAGGVQFDKEADWYPTFETELLRFPKDVHDDQVDAFAWIGLALKNLFEAPTQQEVEDEEWEREYDESTEHGQSWLTGY